jgi:hypothetical protein
MRFKLTKKIAIAVLILFLGFLWVKKVYTETNRQYLKNEAIQNEICPCRKYKYITKGQYECICPAKNIGE